MTDPATLIAAHVAAARVHTDAQPAPQRIQRIQRKRTKGWRMPEGAVYVGRPSIFGNPFRAYKCECCGYWDVRDDNDVTYLVDHQYVRRPEIRANPVTWTTRTEAANKAVQLYWDEATYWVGGRLKWDPVYAEAVESLRGHDLACWCPLDQPCHADVLLEIANAPQPAPAPSPQARFDADGLPRGLMPIAGIRCGEWL